MTTPCYPSFANMDRARPQHGPRALADPPAEKRKHWALLADAERNPYVVIKSGILRLGRIRDTAGKGGRPSALFRHHSVRDGGGVPGAETAQRARPPHWKRTATRIPAPSAAAERCR